MEKLPPVESASCAVTSPEIPENEHAEENMVDAKLVANNRCYLKSAVQAITCLILSQRYNRETQDDFSKDMFNRCYQRALGEDPSLTDITDLLPPEAQFTSQDFQMAVVRTLAQMVLDKIRQKYKESDSKSFCVKGCIRHIWGQGEVLSLVIHFMNEGKPEKHLIGQLKLEQSNADYIADRVLHHLTKYGLNPLYIVSRSYDDGTSFSGCSHDVHGALQRKSNQRIPNVHCDHCPLSLVVVRAIQDVPTIRSLLKTCEMVNDFMLHPHIMQRNGRFTQPQTTALSGPSGYYHLIKNLVSNFNSVYRFVLDLSHEDSVSEELRLDAADILSLLKDKYCLATGKFVLDLLTSTAATARFLPLTAYINYLPFEAKATQVLRRTLTRRRGDPVCLGEYYTTAGTIALSEGSLGEPVPKRQRLADSVMGKDVDYAVPHAPPMADSTLATPESGTESSISESSNEGNRDFNAIELEAFGKYLLQAIDLAIHEMQRRLLRKELTILEAIYVLLPSSLTFLDMDVCLPLLNIARVCRTTVAKQIQEAKPLLSREMSVSMDIAEACEVVYKHSSTFPELYEVYVAAVLMSIPLSDCERSVPAPATVTEHDLNVAIVAHEHVIASSICLDEFVVAFSQNGTKLSL